MDPHLAALIRRNSKKPLPELKLELMKHGFSSYQIEDALEQMKIRDWPIIRTLAILLVLAVVVLAIGFVFVSFIEPAEKMAAGEQRGEPDENEFVQGSVREMVQENVSPSGISEEAAQSVISEETVVSEESVVSENIVSSSSAFIPFAEKDIEEIRKLSLTQKEKALSECSSLPDLKKDSCISLVARTTNDAELCSKIGDLQKRDYCFYFFGQSNKEFCSEISSATLRNYCTTLAGISQRIE